MEITKNKPIVIGSYEGVDFHYVFNENERFLINASDIANHFNLNLSEFLENKDTDRHIKHLLKTENTIGQTRTLDDVLLIDDGVYYFHKFLIYDLCRTIPPFYWWIDGFFYDLMVEYQSPLN